MSKRYRGISDAQANAEALARRSMTYADEHAKSWELRFNGREGGLSTKALVARISTELAEEVPTKLHEGPSTFDDGGAPAWTPAFTAYLDGQPMATFERPAKTDSQGRELNPVIVGTYRKPVQAAIEGMKRGSGRTAWWGRIAERVILGSQHPVEAARAEGSHEFEAHRTANEALSELYRRITPDKMALARRPEAA